MLVKVEVTTDNGFDITIDGVTYVASKDEHITEMQAGKLQDLALAGTQYFALKDVATAASKLEELLGSQHLVDRQRRDRPSVHMA